MENKVICPEDVILVLLPARMIPHTATVSKRTGEVTYVLRHNVTVYGIDEAKGLRAERLREPPINIDGFFLVSERGDINQVKPDTLLHWHVPAEDFVDTLRISWEGTPQ